MTQSLQALTLLLAFGAPELAGATELHPQDFAYGMAIETPTTGTAYRFLIPLEVYRTIAHEDLRDLRVFNVRGQEVPYELLQPTPKPVTRPQGPSLPLFPLRADARATLNGVRVSIHSESAAVDLQTGAASPAPQVITSYVIDGREVTQPLSGLQLHWPDGSAEFSGSMRIESSDDLSTWRIVNTDLPVINLRTGGLELVQSLLEFPSTKAKFWRLTWAGKTAPFELTAVTAEATLDQPSAPQRTATVVGTHVEKHADELAFDLGAKLPVTQLNMALPESNSVVKIELLSRARATDAWRAVAQGEFYRLSAGSSDHRNAPIHIPTNFDRFWLARQIQPAAPMDDVKLEATWDAMDLVFLAQGSGPFLLAYGSASASQSSVPLEPLLKGVELMAAETGASYALGGADRLRPPPRTVPWKMAALWTALGFGVLLLAWMAYRLSRELGIRTTERH